MDPRTVREVAVALQHANLAARDALATLVSVKTRSDAATGERAERLRQSLVPAIRQTSKSVDVTRDLVGNLLRQIGQQDAASTGAGGPRPLKVAGTGNSFESGEGVAKGLSSELWRYFDPQDRRHRSPFAALPQALARLVEANRHRGLKVELYFAASSGAVTRDVFCDQVEEHIVPGVRNRTWQINPAQLFQIPVDSDVVVAGFGGNDALFGPVITKAHTWGFKAELAKASAILSVKDENGHEYTAEQLRHLANTSKVGDEKVPLVVRWLQVIDEIRNRAPNATIVIPNYPVALDPEVMADNSILVSEKEASRIKTRLAEKLNTVLARVVEVAGPGVRLADLSNTLQKHEVYTGQPWINGVDPINSDRDSGYNRYGEKMPPGTLDVPRDTWPENEPFHPNELGHGAMATPFAREIALAKGLDIPATPLAGTVTPTDSITIIQGFSDFDGDGIRDTQDPTPGTPTYFHQGLVSCPAPAKPLFPRRDRDQ